MPPKKKKGGKAKKSKKEVVAVEKKASEYDAMDLDLLQEVTPMLRQQMEKTQMDRNYVQNERNTIQTFYSITKQEVEDYEMAIKTKDREMETMEMNHRTEVRVYIQKVKHLEYEHRKSVKHVDDTAIERLDEEAESHASRKTQLKANKTSLKLELKERELSNEEEIEQMKHAHEKNLSKLRQEFEKNLEGVKGRVADSLEMLQEDLELRRKVDIHEIEERKNLHINDLMKNHENAFTQVKHYYNDITQDNLKLIKTLKDEIQTMKTKASANQTLMFDISQENKRLSDPLCTAVREVERLTHELKDQTKDSLSLKNAKARVVLTEKKVMALTRDNVVSQQQVADLETSRQHYYDAFDTTVSKIQRQGDFKNILLEQRIGALASATDESDTQVSDLCVAAALDPTMVETIHSSTAAQLASQNHSIADLQYRIARATKAYNDSLLTFEAKLQGAGLPQDAFEELGYQPMGHSVTNPAGLVV